MRWLHDEGRPPLQAGTRIGPFEVLGRIGRGGSAHVYAVSHVNEGAQYALKVPHTIDPTHLHRLEREAEFQQSLDAERVVPVLDVIRVKGAPALLMPLVQGCTLAHVVAAGAVPPGEVAALGVALLDALEVIHQAGILHRDLKPSNVLLDLVEGRVRVRVADFGVAARLHTDSVQSPNGFRGTHAYAAPEGLVGTAPVDEACDYWSLGVVLHELLTTQRPSRGSEEWSGIPPGWEPVLDGLLQRDPAERTRVPSQLREQLEAVGSVPLDARGHVHRVVERWLDQALVTEQGHTEVPIPAGQTEEAIERALELSPIDKRVHVVAAYADRHVVQREVMRLESYGVDARYRVPDEPLDVVDAATKVSIARADSVLVFWSAAARRDPLVRESVRFALEVAAHREPPGPLPEDGFVGGTSIDGTELPAELASSAGRVTPSVVGAGGASALGLIVSLQLHDAAVPVVLCALGLTGAVVVAWMQWMRRADRLISVSRLYEVGQWIAKLDAAALLAVAERVLDRLYGPRLLSFRSVLTSALLSWSVVLVIAGGFGAYALDVTYGIGASMKETTRLLGIWVHRAWFLTWQMALANMVLDFVSLVCTRSIVRGIVRNPTTRRLAGGLLLDLVIVVVIGVAVLYANVETSEIFENGPGRWLLTVVGYTWWIPTGRIGLISALRDPSVVLILGCGMTMFTAFLPSLVHAALLGAALLNRLLGGLPSRGIGEALRRAADSRQGPWTMALVGWTLGALATLATTLGIRATTSVPDDASLWATIDPADCNGPCVVGCPAETGRCGERNPLREVADPPAPYRIMRTELTQAVWTQVWDAAGQVSPDRYGLWRNPAIFRGADHPLTGATWCDVLRFANLWTAMEQRGRHPDWQPVYAVGPDGGPELTRCEVQMAERIPGRIGYRLPTELEWEIAARGGAKTLFAWGDDGEDMGRMARGFPYWTPGGVSQLEPNGFGLYDVHGNVSEYTEGMFENDEYGPWPVHRGGTAGHKPKHLYLGLRVSLPATWRSSTEGARLVAPLLD